MFKKHFVLTIAILAIICSCGGYENHKLPIETALASENPKIKRVVDAINQHEVQIIYTQIERKNGDVQFTDHMYQIDSSQYFYPASTVKFPIALLALYKLNSIENIDRNTRFYVEGDTLETTFAKEIEKIFAVSDNEAYNRLFEFLGQDYINQELNQISLGPVRISHRLSTFDADEITTKPLIIYLNDSTTATLSGSINTSAQPILKKGIQKGTGFYEEDSFMSEPFDFSLKNYYPIKTQHQLLKTVMFPEKYQLNERITLTNDQLEFVHSAMSTVPKKVGYDVETYYDGYCKFFMFGDTKEDIPEYIKIYNKVGDAYGTLTDCAYIKDTKNDLEFMVTATILVNKNAIFNDDTYEYDEIGFPFLAQLGRELYTYELNQK